MSVHKGKHEIGKLPTRLKTLIHGISTIEELEKAWDKALAESPGSLMAELDPEVQRKYREIVNKRLREQFQKEKL